MNKQTILMGLFLIILFSSLACDASATVTPAVGLPATPQVATLASIDLNAPVASPVQAAPAATEALVATETPANATPTSPAGAPVKTATPTSTATMVPNSRSNPVAAGTAAQVETFQILVNGIVRPADSIVQSANALNFTNAAGTGKEYLFVKVSLTCEKPADQECILSVFNFKSLGSDGVLINPETTIAGVDGLLTSKIFYGGTTQTGNIPFIVTKGDANILLVYQTSLGEKVYLTLPAQ